MSEVKITKYGLVVPHDVADDITLANLKEVRERLIKELEDYKNGKWMHSEDVLLNKELIPMLDKLIWFFGGLNEYYN